MSDPYKDRLARCEWKAPYLGTVPAKDGQPILDEDGQPQFSRRQRQHLAAAWRKWTRKTRWRVGRWLIQWGKAMQNRQKACGF